jgi:hypothetical protein
MRLNLGSCRIAHAPTQFNIQTKAPHSIAKLLNGPWRLNDKAIHSLADQLPCPILHRRDNRQTGIHRFEHDQTAGIVKRRECKQVTSRENRPNIIHKSEKANPVGYPQPGGLTSKSGVAITSAYYQPSRYVTGQTPKCN